MSLTAALDHARSGLQATAAQTALVSRNIEQAGSPLYARRTAELTRPAFGGIEYLGAARASNHAVLARFLEATSDHAGQSVVAEGLDRLSAAAFSPDEGSSLASLGGALRNALQLAASAPHDASLAGSVLTRAQELARGLNDAAAAIQRERREADAGIVASVERIGTLLGQFEQLNTEIVIGTRADVDVLDAMDSRDRVMQSLSEELGLTVIRRGDNDIALFLESGQTLFETRARTVSFAATPWYAAATTGAAVLVDGVPVAGPGAVMPARSGRIAGLVAMRDATAPQLQTRVDEMARALIDMFSESDQSAVPALPTRPGLFTWSGDPALPGAAIMPGLAGDIRVNANADPAQGGDVLRIRDGGVSDPLQPAYRYNTAGAASFSDRLDALAGAFSATRAFDPAAGLGAQATAIEFTELAIGSFAAMRQTTRDAANYQSLLAERSGEALSNSTGVNLDTEMGDMLKLERAYEASARMVATVDELFQILFDAVR